MAMTCQKEAGIAPHPYPRMSRIAASQRVGLFPHCLTNNARETLFATWAQVLRATTGALAQSVVLGAYCATERRNDHCALTSADFTQGGDYAFGPTLHHTQCR